ncbi:hypothetical protein PLICRDRAFT_51540 [Plicaturopsis crispa FD-325 SS-3]|nr:hypothetical protein PLICRDRAFT_51540 [Plicaturopsis crispa FD-325 SS-3]
MDSQFTDGVTQFSRFTFLPRLLASKSWFSRLKLSLYLSFTRPSESAKVRFFRLGIPLVLKQSLRTTSTESDALRFLNSSAPYLPIPHLVDSFILDDTSYALMTKLPGRPLFDIDEATKEEMHVIGQDVHDFLDELWKIPQSPSIAGQVMLSASGHGLPDPRQFHEELVGPFPSTVACYTYLAGMDWESDSDSEKITGRWPEPEVAALASDDISWVHMDLRLHNILVQNGRLSGIIDWEDSGWLPRHWQLAVFREPFRHGMKYHWLSFWHEGVLGNVAEEAYKISKNRIEYPL